MTPAERKKLNEDRANLKGYRNRLMLLKDVVPNINELWHDNSKIVKFFESGKAAKFESRINIKPGKPIDKPRQPLEVKTELTVEKFRELKEKGTSDKLIREQYKMNSNKLIAWKKTNGVDNLNLPGGIHKTKANKKEEAKDVAKVSIETKQGEDNTARKIEQEYKERITTLNLKNQRLEESLEESGTNISELKQTSEIAIKAQKQAMDELKESKEKLYEANLIINGMAAELEEIKTKNTKFYGHLELAQKAEKKAIDELIQFQAEYRNLEVDYRNQSSEVTRLREMLEKLKHTSQINVWLMEQHIGFVNQLDNVVG